MVLLHYPIDRNLLARYHDQRGPDTQSLRGKSYEFPSRSKRASLSGPTVSLVVGVEATGTDGGEDGGGDEGILMTLARGWKTGVDVDEIGLCHCMGSCGMVIVGETGAIVGEGAVIVVDGED